MGHRKRRPEGPLVRLRRKAQPPLLAATNIVRPPVLIVVAVAGVWFAIDFLQRYEWHHLMFAWVISLVIGLWALYRPYRDFKDPVTVGRWLAEENAGEALAEVEDVRKAVRRLPPWWHRKYAEKKRELEAQR